MGTRVLKKFSIPGTADFMTHDTSQASPEPSPNLKTAPLTGKEFKGLRFMECNRVYVRGVVASNPEHTRAFHGTRDTKFVIELRDYERLRGRDPKLMYFWVRLSGYVAHKASDWISKGNLVEIWGWLESRYFVHGGEKVLWTEIHVEKIERMGGV